MGARRPRWSLAYRLDCSVADRASLSLDDYEEEERRRFDKLRADLAAWERWNLLPLWKREWFGEKTREELQKIDNLIDLADDIPGIRKSIKLAENAETAGRFWRKGLMAFFGGILVLGPGLKMLGEMWQWASGLFRKLGAP